jgi:hypothetical protein
MLCPTEKLAVAGSFTVFASSAAMTVIGAPTVVVSVAGFGAAVGRG